MKDFEVKIKNSPNALIGFKDRFNASVFLEVGLSFQICYILADIFLWLYVYYGVSGNSLEYTS